MIKTLSIIREFPGCIRKNDAWHQLTEFKNYPEIVPYIDSVRILESNPQSYRTEWFITLDGAPFSWTEFDTLLEEQFVLRYMAVSGDFDVLQGEYKIEDTPDYGGIRIIGSLSFELGIPVIEENCSGILMEKFTSYLTAIVEKHGALLQKRAIDERRFERIRINRHCACVIDGRLIEACFTDLSRGGIALALTRGMLGTERRRPARLKFTSVEVQGVLLFDERYRIHRIHFDEPLDETEMKTLFAELMNSSAVPDGPIAIYDVLTAPATASPRIVSKKTVL